MSFTSSKSFLPTRSDRWLSAVATEGTPRASQTDMGYESRAAAAGQLMVQPVYPSFGNNRSVPGLTFCARLGHQQAPGTTRGHPQLEVRLSPLGRVQRRGSQLE